MGDAPPAPLNPAAEAHAAAAAIDPSLPWSERKRLMVMAKGQWGDQAFAPPPPEALPGAGDSEEAKALQAKVRQLHSALSLVSFLRFSILFSPSLSLSSFVLSRSR
jgi:hypothetical protein